MSIAYTLTDNPLQPGRMRALVLRQSMSLDEFLEFCQRSSTLSTADVRAVLDCMADWMARSAQLGKEAHFGDLGRTRLGIKTPPLSAGDEQLDHGKTVLTINWEVSRRLKKKVAELGRSSSFEYVRHTRPLPRPSIESVEDRQLKQADVYRVGKVLRISGERLKFDADCEDEGVFFKLAGGTEVRAVEYTHVARRTVDARVPVGVSGQVDVIIRNRGWSKHEPNPRQGEYDATLAPADG